MVAAHELGIAGDLELLTTTRETIGADVSPDNPLAQIPTLVADDGTVIFDSLPVIDYLDRHAGGDLIPADGPARWATFRRHTIGNEIMSAGVFWQTTAGQPMPGKLMDRAIRGLDALDADAGALAEQFTAGEITVACALGYLDFRHSGKLDWRAGRTRLASLYELWAQRPSMRETAPPDEG
jgi:glutathione S-transferase